MVNIIGVTQPVTHSFKQEKKTLFARLEVAQSLTVKAEKVNSGVEVLNTRQQTECDVASLTSLLEVNTCREGGLVSLK